MKRTILALLAIFILAHAPWRLMVLVAETFVVAPGHTRVTITDAHYWDVLGLETRLADLGWPVSYAPSLNVGGDRAYGVTDPNTHTITLDSTLHWDERYAVLVHEGGHVLQPGWVSRAQGEIFAECVAALVADDGIREHARYLGPHRFEVLMLVMVEWRTMQHAASVLQDR